MLAVQPAAAARVDIRSIVDRSSPTARAKSPGSPGNRSTSSNNSSTPKSQASRSERPDSRYASADTSHTTSSRTTLPSISATFPPPDSPIARRPYPRSQHQQYPPPSAGLQQTFQFPQSQYYGHSHPLPGQEVRLPHIPVSHALATSKRTASPHPSEEKPKKKQTKWKPEEDALIIRLRGNGMKWEDISKQLHDRSAISCRLRFQNYLERRAEWDEEKKNKLARLYERFKKEMWEKIAKEMAIPWRAAEAMHWHLGEINMAQRANVQVFHLDGGAGGSGHHGHSPLGHQYASSDDRASSYSPRPSIDGENYYALPSHSAGPPGYYHHSHTHSLPHLHAPPPSLPPPPAGLHCDTGGRMRRSSVGGASSFSTFRPRADSARSVMLPQPVPAPLQPPGGYYAGSTPPSKGFGSSLPAGQKLRDGR